MDKSDNILNNLTTVNGKEKFEPKAPAKKVAKIKSVAKKPVQSKPFVIKPRETYSAEKLSKLTADNLATLCKHYKLDSSEDKQKMIEALLGK